MSNLRIVANNLAAGATITASSAAGALVAANLGTDDKSALWRSAAGTAAQINAAWGSSMPVSCAALVNCNLSPTATMRVNLSAELSVTNTRLYSSRPDLSPWRYSSASVAVSASLGPDGATLAYDLIEASSATALNHSAVADSDFVAGTMYTRSVFAKELAAGVGAKRYLLLSFGAAAFGTNLTAVFDLAAGTFVRSSTSLTTSMQLINGYYRCSITATATITTTVLAQNTRLVPAYTAAGQMYLGDGVSGLTIWGEMMNVGPLSSYYPSGAVAGVRPAGYMDTWQSYDYDSGPVLCCPAPARVLRGWTPAQAASAYAYGGGATAVVWLPAMQATGVRVTVSDAGNLQGYIEAATLVIGEYWSPQRNAGYGAVAASVDTSANTRTAAGGLITDAGTVHRTMSFSLEHLTPADRTAMFDIAIANGMRYPMLVSLMPGSGDAAAERDHTIYGKLSRTSSMMVARYRGYSTSIELEEI